MTLPDERTSAVDRTRQFLIELANGQIKRIPKAIRRQASSLLKHYPGPYDMKRTIEAIPDVFGKPWVQKGELLEVTKVESGDE